MWWREGSSSLGGWLCHRKPFNPPQFYPVQCQLPMARLQNRSTKKTGIFFKQKPISFLYQPISLDLCIPLPQPSQRAFLKDRTKYTLTTMTPTSLAVNPTLRTHFSLPPSHQSSFLLVVPLCQKNSFCFPARLPQQPKPWFGGTLTWGRWTVMGDRLCAWLCSPQWWLYWPSLPSLGIA